MTYCRREGKLGVVHVVEASEGLHRRLDLNRSGECLSRQNYNSCTDRRPQEKLALGENLDQKKGVQ